MGIRWRARATADRANSTVAACSERSTSVWAGSAVRATSAQT